MLVKLIHEIGGSKQRGKLRKKPRKRSSEKKYGGKEEKRNAIRRKNSREDAPLIRRLSGPETEKAVTGADRSGKRRKTQNEKKVGKPLPYLASRGTAHRREGGG